MSNYTPAYPNGWKDNLAGNTPITATALNNMENGIMAAFRSDNLIAIYGQPINFNKGIGYYSDPRIRTGHVVPFVQLRASSPESVTNTTLGVTVEEGRLLITMDYEKTVQNLPVNIIAILI